MNMQHTEALEEPLFKVNKRRKAYRQRVNKDDEVAFTASASATPILSSPDEVPVESRRAETTSDTTISMAEILKARKTRKSHARGVAFGIPPTTSSQQVFPLPEIEDEASHQDDAEGGSGLRFSKQRGILGDVNKHMYVIIRSGIDSMDGVTETNQARMAYIESEIARQRQAGEPTTHASTNNEPVISHDVSQPQKQAVTLGKIQEIDLGDEPRDRNASMTERARRMAIGETSSDHDQAKKPSKSRLGPDGKPWRDRKRRASDDIKRDFIVDEFLRENKIEMYDDIPVQMRQRTGNGENDDWMAEEFTRDFLESQSQRRRPGGLPMSSTGSGKPGDDMLKGPKLGGSRNMRAKMQAEMMKNTKK